MAEATPSGTGGAPQPSQPPDDGMLRIRGGVGGLSFQFEELLAGAAALEGVLRQLQEVEMEADAVRHALFPYQPDSYASGSSAITAVGEGARAIGRVRLDLERMAREVRASQREYEFTEARNALLLRMGLYGAEYGSGSGIFGLPPMKARDIAEDGIAMLPRNLALLLGVPVTTAAAIGAAGGPTDVRRIVRGLAAAPGLEFLRPRPVRIAGQETRTEEADLAPAGLLRRAEAVGRTSGDIEVLQTGSGGQRAWVVIIPGTQLDGLPEGTNPFDIAGIAESLGFDSAEMNAAVREALREAGAEAGEQVAAVGYSQGGIHAMNLSQDRAFLAEYDLKFVLTAGSPVGGIEPAPGIGSLHLEHEQDLVPGADGLPNADTKERVTVTLTNPLILTNPLDFGAWDDVGLGPGHRLANYAEGAEAVSVSRDPSLQASTAALAAVVGAGGGARVTRFSLRRDAAPRGR
ncbi:hypothetical protein E5206_03685 [Arthrobacter sp. PAMC25564]|uniref:hypothetical protein n=1 Tax=Arthrobacter sp. PAMC25564 TaxID=2565366 RepID=UPI0010A270E3|nr:hypothetical protein [Arthrobacter sp. PAMC25564]QCB96137.1 hypothetical protein E5206_03685 [Arthrobacter sp. PAMC25564]